MKKGVDSKLKETFQEVQPTPEKREKFSASGQNITDFKCLRNQEDNSIYYGEIAYLNKKTGTLILQNTEQYTQEIAILDAETR